MKSVSDFIIKASGGSSTDLISKKVGNLVSVDETIQEDAFYKVWTRKEAHMKVTGKGLHLPPTQFEISIPPKPAAFIRNLQSADNNYYKMLDIDLPDTYNDYHASLSASFDFQEVKSFIHS